RREHHLANGRRRGPGGRRRRAQGRGWRWVPIRARSGGIPRGLTTRPDLHSIEGKPAFTSERHAAIVATTGPAPNSPVGSGGPTDVVPSFHPCDRRCSRTRVLDEHRGWHGQRVRPHFGWGPLLGTCVTSGRSQRAFRPTETCGHLGPRGPLTGNAPVSVRKRPVKPRLTSCLPRRKVPGPCLPSVPRWSPTSAPASAHCGRPRE